MSFDFSSKLRKNKIIRIAALIYGLIFFNIGVLVLLDKITTRSWEFDSTMRWGVGCFVIGAVVLVAVFLSKPAK